MMTTYTEFECINNQLSELINKMEKINENNKINSVYYYEQECYDIINIICNDVRAVISLAQSDLIYINGAKIICRSVFEASAKVQWIMNPECNFDKENRWLASVKEASKSLKKFIVESEKYSLSHLDGGYQEKIENMDSMIDRVSHRLIEFKPSIKILNGMPDFRQILEDSGFGFMYIMYMDMSANVHVSHSNNGLHSLEYGLNKGGIVWQWWNVYSLLFISIGFGVRDYMTYKLDNENALFTDEYGDYIKVCIDKLLTLANRLVL